MDKQISKLTHSAAGYNVTLAYLYDANGNIISVSDGANTTIYAYDAANQLTRENNQAGKTSRRLKLKAYIWRAQPKGSIIRGRLVPCKAFRLNKPVGASNARPPGA